MPAQINIRDPVVSESHGPVASFVTIRMTSHDLLVFNIMDWVPLARLAVLLVLAVVVSVTAAVSVAVPAFPPVAVPFPLPVEYLRWEA